MDRESVRRDTIVAAVAAGGAVVATLVVQFLFAADVSLIVRAAPLYVYGLYLFTRKGGPYGRFDTPRTWAALAVLASAGVVVYGFV